MSFCSPAIRKLKNMRNNGEQTAIISKAIILFRKATRKLTTTGSYGKILSK